MIVLSETLKAWQSPMFQDVFKKEVSRLDGRLLPLQKAISQGSVANENDFSVVVLGISEDDKVIGVKAGVFYTSLIAGCACADDPTPENELPEYCEIRFDIDKESAKTSIHLL